MDVRPVLFIDGFLLLALALAMMLPAAVEVAWGGPDAAVFLAAATATAFLGGALVLGSRPEGRIHLDIRQTLLLTVSAWSLAILCSAQPFLFGRHEMGLADAVFEAASGLTTTGATVVDGLDRASGGVLLWRALLNWLGGMGVVLMGLAVLPVLRVGGMQMFRMESSDKTDAMRPRVSQLAAAIVLVYAVFTMLSALAFLAAGMSAFDALCHAMAALSTGGFSTSDSSLGHWGAGVQAVATVSMVVAGAPLPLFAGSWRRGRPLLASDSQVGAYLWLLTFFVILAGLWRWATSDGSFGESFLHAAFGVTSIVTTTGFVSTDYAAWGGFAHVAFVLLAFSGGCTGTATGAIKIFRWQVLFSVAKVQIKRLLHPHGVFVVSFNRRNLPNVVADSVLAFVVLYFATYAAYALVLTVTGMELTAALAGSAAALGNVGRGLGEAFGMPGSWHGLPTAAKAVLASEMVVGRLELFTVFVLFTPGFWRE